MSVYALTLSAFPSGLESVRQVVCSRCAELRPAITMNAIHTRNAPYLAGGLFRDWAPISEGVLKPGLH